MSGTFSLGDFSIGAAATQVGDAVDDLSGALAVTLSARLAYGSGGTSCYAVIETSLDQGVTWVQIARFDFTTSGLQKVLTVSGLTPRIAAATAGSLAADTALDGTLGDRLRATVVSTGTYAGSTVVSVRANVR
jgi:hypothetical protein